MIDDKRQYKPIREKNVRYKLKGLKNIRHNISDMEDKIRVDKRLYRKTCTTKSGINWDIVIWNSPFITYI